MKKLLPILLLTAISSSVYARNTSGVFLGGLVDGLNGQQSQPVQTPQYTEPTPQQRYVDIQNQNGKTITLDRQTGIWTDSEGNSGTVRLR